MNRANAGSVADRALHALSDAELVTESLPCASGAGCYPWLFALTLPLPVGLLCLYGRGLPHGDQHLVRVDLGRQEATLHVHQAAYLADLWRHPERARQFAARGRR